MSRVSKKAIAATKSIALVGMPASGKSLLGKVLAAELRLPFIDSDRLITARIGAPISRLFKTAVGEELFRKVEKRVVIDAATSPLPLVLALGGGGFGDEKVRNRLLASVFCCWLDCPPELLWHRLAADSRRPLLKAVNEAEKRHKLEKLAAARLPIYALAHYRLSLAVRVPPADSVGEIIRAAGEFNNR